MTNEHVIQRAQEIMVTIKVAAIELPYVEYQEQLRGMQSEHFMGDNDDRRSSGRRRNTPPTETFLPSG